MSENGCCRDAPRPARAKVQIGIGANLKMSPIVNGAKSAAGVHTETQGFENICSRGVQRPAPVKERMCPNASLRIKPSACITKIVGIATEDG
jgi:hypothetical protein